jgi:Cu/Ag efflux pump CusA
VKSSLVRTAILVLTFLPFVYYAGKDAIFHLRGRKVSATENLLHLGLGLVLATLFSLALAGRHAAMVGALILFVVAGALDEFVYHRHIPGEESDLHAKEHLALFAFLVTVLAFDWLQTHGWQVTSLVAG